MIDLQATAKDLWREILEGWKPNTPDIIEHYDLTQAQASQVKKIIRKMAVEKGVIWGWYPPEEQFILAPHNTPQVAETILRYVLDHWKDAGANADLTFSAACGQGYLDDDWKTSINLLRTAFDVQIDAVLKKLGYRFKDDLKAAA